MHDNKQHGEYRMDQCNRSCHRDCLHSLRDTFLHDIVVAKSSQIHLAFEHCIDHIFADHRCRYRRPIDLVDNRLWVVWRHHDMAVDGGTVDHTLLLMKSAISWTSHRSRSPMSQQSVQMVSSVQHHPAKWPTGWVAAIHC